MQPVPPYTSVFNNPKYKGKHILLMGNKVIAAGGWEYISKVFDRTLKKTKKAPELTYIPKEDILIM